MEFEGQIETHITVSADEQEAQMLSRFASERGHKFAHIVLDTGEYSSQPMLTSEGRGGLSTQLQQAAGLVGDIGALGLTVRRVKIEAAPTNDDIPVSDDEARDQPPERHFEHHIKLLLPSDPDLRLLNGLLGLHSARLSRNARRSRADGFLERFATQRFYGVGRDTAGRSLNQLVEELKSKGYNILEVEMEYVVHDSNQRLDVGWTDMGMVRR
jgi:hypothetical protein